MLTLLAGSLAFVAIGVWIRGDHPVSGYASIIFFGACAAVSCVNLLPKSSYLTITHQEFTMCSMLRRRSIEWHHVSPFGIAWIGSRKMVGWDPAHEISTVGKATKAFSGYVSALPDTYGLDAEELAVLLNRLRDEHIAQCT